MHNGQLEVCVKDLIQQMHYSTGYSLSYGFTAMPAWLLLLLQQDLP
jgi:hypothetical protein